MHEQDKFASPQSEDMEPAPPSTLGVVAQRFRLQSVAASGGMGTVYRALDTASGQTVAVKLLHADRGDRDAERFLREAELLRTLHHPGIVAYLAHGQTDGGELYLAMEWLDGEDLAHRLSFGPLTMGDARLLLRKVTEALALAHRQDIIHRDLKPSNLFLRDHQIERVALLDFGIARLTTTSQLVTATGMILGTPAYMAPEQARGDSTVTPAADIFSLGCVFFECLTGRRPFLAEQPLAVLARILFDEAPRAKLFCPDIPPAFETLLDRMLAKKPEERFPDAAALLETLDRLEDVRLTLSPKRAPRSEERALLSVLIANLSPPPTHTEISDSRETDIPEERRATLIQELQQEFTARNAKLEMLGNGWLVATLEHSVGAATDLVGHAAQCAFLIKARFSRAVIALSTGRGYVDENSTQGEVFERAVALLRDSSRAVETSQILVDDTSRGLLEMRFLVAQLSSGTYALVGEKLGLDASRPLLGKPTPCVGRDVELTILDSIFKSCVDDAEPRAALIRAPPGMGKSRVLHELLRRIETRGDELRIWVGRGDPISTSSPYGFLAQALRRRSGILDGEPLEVRREKLTSMVKESVGDEHALRVATFAAEICGAPFDDTENVQLRAARQDPVVMSAQINKAIMALLRAECARQPVLFVMEDLQWSDALTVQLTDLALRELSDCPLMLLALARPEIEELFPKLWGDRAQRIALGPLSKKAGERLVHQVLGKRATPTLAARIVAQSEGNALFLEELIRAAAEGHGDEVPESVIAMLQARIGRLDAGPRRVLRMASVFGERCYRGGIRALLDPGLSEREIDECLHVLCKEEIFELHLDSRFAGEKEYRFRHLLMRDAAYGLLGDADREVAHALTAAYLEQMGENDPFVLAEHYHRGGAKEDAVRWYVRAAKDAFERHDMAGALRAFEAGTSSGASADALRMLQAVQASAYFWMDKPEQTCTYGEPVVSELAHGSYFWCRLVGGLLGAAGGLGRVDTVNRLQDLLFSVEPADDAKAAFVEAVCFLNNMSCRRGLREKSQAILARMDAVSASAMATNPVVRGWVCCGHAYHTYFFGHEPKSALQWATKGSLAFAEVHDERNQVPTEIIAGLACAALGREEALSHLRAGLRLARQVGQPYPISFAEIQLAFVLIRSSDEDERQEAVRLAEPWAQPSAPNLVFHGIAHDILAQRALQLGDLDEAQKHAQAASDALRPFGPHRLWALATRSEVQRQMGQLEDAIQSASEGVELAKKLGGSGEIAARVALTDGLFAADRREQAIELLRETTEQLRERLAGLDTTSERERYMHCVPSNARVEALAKEWLNVETIT